MTVHTEETAKNVLDDNTSFSKRLPDTEEYVVNDKVKMRRNNKTLRFILEALLRDLPNFGGERLSSNQFALVSRVSETAGRKIAKLSLLKPHQKPFYRDCAECSQAEFLVEIDETLWNESDQIELERALDTLLMRIVHDDEKNLYVLSKPDYEVSLGVVRKYGKDIPAVNGVLSALNVHEKEAAGGDQ
jgi:hypothetical protein